MTWSELSRSDRFRGRWVALEQCRYDKGGAQPAEGDLVDSDIDLAALCERVKKADKRHCAILFCEEEAEPSRPPISSRPR
ncbi:MAG: hypothetical protein IT374_27460 [Polyangiaceae bacterium]|nr:hypothetical protein [Polyangiaceae bacterium]